MKYYIGYYQCDKIRNEERVVSPAAESKMNYIISALTAASDEPIEVVSPASTKAHRIIKGNKQKIGDTVTLKTFFSFSSKYKLIRGLGILLTRTAVFLYLLKNVRRDDHLIVYHSLLLMQLVKVLKKVKKCKLTIEVEEIYADVTEDERCRKKEIEYHQIADSYLFITELLRNEINTGKPFIISHGTYMTVPDLRYCFDDGKIHVVYAGTFSRVKGGVFTAVSAAEYLGEEYALDIMGSGSQEDVQLLKEKIQEVSKKTKCSVNFLGLKSGDDFNSYIQACHIGLSTQQPTAKFNATSFPSKILMYMSNGLRVVSIRIPAIETSKVGEHIYYYDKQDAKVIADAIRMVPLNNGYDSRELLQKLHGEFVEDIKSLLRR